MKHGFTLIELIVVIIIVGILAAIGLSQYSLIVEKSRLAEAKIRIGVIRQLAYEYYLTNGNVTSISNSYVGVDDTCRTTNFYKYSISPGPLTSVYLFADRCMDSGKTPNLDHSYVYYVQYYPASGVSIWHCAWNDDNSSCFGLPP